MKFIFSAMVVTIHLDSEGRSHLQDHSSKSAFCRMLNNTKLIGIDAWRRNTKLPLLSLGQCHRSIVVTAAPRDKL